MVANTNQLYDRLLRAINDPSPSSKDEHDRLYAPDSVFVSYPLGLSVPVRDIPDFKFESLQRAFEGDTVFEEAVISGTYRGSERWLGVGVPNSSFAVRVTAITKFNQEGKVARRAIYWDKDSLVRQLSGAEKTAGVTPKISFELTPDERALLDEFGVQVVPEYGYR